MAAIINIVTEEHIRAFAAGELSELESADVANAIRDDDRAAAIYAEELEALEKFDASARKFARR